MRNVVSERNENAKNKTIAMCNYVGGMVLGCSLPGESFFNREEDCFLSSFLYFCVHLIVRDV